MIRKLKIPLAVIFFFYGFISIAQSNANEFWKIQKEKFSLDSLGFARKWKGLSTKNNIDSLNKDSIFLAFIDSLFTENEKILGKLIGCEFPDATTLLSNDESLSTIYNDFTILNFHRYDGDTIQLEDLATLKKESCESITVIAFFAESQENIQNLINKYKNEIVFVSDAKEYIDAHNFNTGHPFLWILNKEKVIKYAKSAFPKKKGKLCWELKNEMSTFLDTYR